MQVKKKIEVAQRGDRGSAKAKFFPKHSQWNFQGSRNSYFSAGGLSTGSSQFMLYANVYPAAMAASHQNFSGN